MSSNEWIPVKTFCVSHHVEVNFIDTLKQFGLVEITTIEQQDCFAEERLEQVEQYLRLHYDLDINFEGIEAIGHLLEKLRAVQEQNLHLQNRLRLYESEAEGSL